jgi:VWFA-related protein
MKAALLVFGITCVLAFASGILVSEQSGQTQPTQKQPEFRQAVDLVLVNTFVTDKEGQPVPGLTRADFEVYEDGNQQVIGSFQAFQYVEDKTQEAPAPQRASPNSLSRLFAIVVDDQCLKPQLDTARERKAVGGLIRAAGDGDEILLVTTSAKISALETLPEGRERLLSLAQEIDGFGSRRC